MPTVTAVAEPTLGRVRVEVSWQDTGGVTYARVLRGGAAGVEVRMYGNTVEAADGNTYKLLSNRLMVLYDTELPLDVSTTYYTHTYSGVSSASATSSSVSVASSSMCWLKDPLYPANDLQVGFTGIPNPECVTTPAIYVLKIPELSFAAASAVIGIEGARRPAVGIRIRKDYTGQLDLATRTLGDMDRLRLLLASGGPLLWQMPAIYGMADAYLQVQDVTEARISTDHRVPWRQHQLPFIAVDRPAGFAYGVDGARWRDLCDVYGTWAGATAASKTWVDVLQREAG